MKIHYMGIGGSGISGIAIMAKKDGFEVTGCDLETKTDYTGMLDKEGIEVQIGHSAKHIEDCDLVVISPAILYQNANHPEVSIARGSGKLITWEEFAEKYLGREKETICIAGTHGKSTTTALAGLTFESAGLDPMVIMGAKVKEWNGNYRYGKGNYKIIEADEFNGNFLHYKPTTLLINNIEMDHADYFKNEGEIINTFLKLIQNLTDKKQLIINQDDPGTLKLFSLAGHDLLKDLKVAGYSIKDEPLIHLKDSYKISISESNVNGTKFNVDHNGNNSYEMALPGKYNVQNATGVIILSDIYNIDRNIIRSSVLTFNGIGRRLEQLGIVNGVTLYDDYAHHPTAIKETIDALRQKHPTERIWVINEPHSYSRTKALLPQYKNIFNKADKVVISPIFKARDKEDFGITPDSIVKVSGHSDIRSYDSFKDIVNVLSVEIRKGDIILVMGAGLSYTLARQILELIKK